MARQDSLGISDAIMASGSLMKPELPHIGIAA